MSDRVPILPAPLLADLARLREALARGDDIDALLADVLSGLALLPSAQIARWDGAIAAAAALWRRPASSGKAWLLPILYDDAARLSRTPALARVFLFHRDGRLREKALAALRGDLRDPFTVAAVLWRLNDWVPAVRAAAHRCAERTLPATGAAVVATTLAALLVRQSSWGRWETEQAIVDRQLTRPDVAGALATLIRAGGAGPWTAVLRAALRSPALDGELPRMAAEALQPSVRAAALNALIDREAVLPAGWAWRWIDKSMGVRRRERTFVRRSVATDLSRDELIGQGAADRSAVVRRVALAGVIRHSLGSGAGRALAARLADDASRSVREKAAFILKA